MGQPGIRRNENLVPDGIWELIYLTQEQREMRELMRIPADTLENIGSAEAAGAEQLLGEAIEGFDKKIIVLDDDPTGVQTVHDVSVYTDWEEASIRQGFGESSPVFFILTNSRSFSEEETVKAHEEIGRRVCRIAKELKRDFLLVSRGDSTLRGHFPLETETLGRVLEEEQGKTVDGEIICPFFPEGGRFTIDNVHYVKEYAKGKEELVPAGMTEFAKDKTFGFSSSDLGDYIEEKTAGRYKKESCITVSLEELHELDVDGIKQKLLSAENMAKIIVNAVTYADLKVFCTAFAMAVKEGKVFLARTAAAFPKVIGRVTDQPLLTRNQLVGNETKGGIVLVGSHVKKTTDQLECLRTAQGNLDFLEFHVNACFREGGLDREVDETVEQAEELIRKGHTAVIYTSRQLLAPEGMTPEEMLKISVNISDAVTGIIGKLSVKPKFIIAKGGITSSDVGTRALRVKKARVMGQVKKGIPVWMTGEESKFPGMPYIIFPGNVGEVSTLKEIVEELL